MKQIKVDVSDELYNHLKTLSKMCGFYGVRDMTHQFYHEMIKDEEKNVPTL